VSGPFGARLVLFRGVLVLRAPRQAVGRGAASENPM